jgi:glycosyltransferase involved in cell wall biosynthesis
MSVTASQNAHIAMPHVLMTLDAVGGVWRYAMDLAAGLSRRGYRFTFAGLGPHPSSSQRSEAERIGHLTWLEAPLDWLAGNETQLDSIPDLLSAIVSRHGVDLAHLNLPSQACGLKLDIPVLVMSHSCVVTWFACVRHSEVPIEWQWQVRRNRQGFDAADAVLAPSRSHAHTLSASYGAIRGLNVVHNGTTPASGSGHKVATVFAAGRWWDDGKNGALLDSAAANSAWPVVMAGSCEGPNGQQCELRNSRTLGQISATETSQWMARAAIVASPSRYEPFGLAPLEGATAGAALVLADIPTYRELWDGAALFAAADDPIAFGDALNRLAGDHDARQEFAARAQERSGLYTLQAQVNAMTLVYDDLLHRFNARVA